MKLEKVKEALKLNQRAYDRIRSIGCMGRTEQELLSEVKAVYGEENGEPLPCLYDLLSGERGGAISGEATDRRVRRGDTVIFDLLPCVEGNWCDTTRTFFMGEPAEHLKAAYEAVLAAIRAGEAVLKPGMSGDGIFRAVSGALVQNGCAPLPHHAGHAVGGDNMEEPDFVRGCEGTLKEGMVVTLEPGVYFPGENGIRVENNYLITESGCELLFEYPTDLTFFILEENEQ